MIWIDGARFYYNGLLYDFASRRIVWRIPNPCDPTREISAWCPPAPGGPLYVNVRTGANAGFYTIDPHSDATPALKPWLGRADVAPQLDDAAGAHFTYLFPSPGGKRVYFVMLDRGVEKAFVRDAEGGPIARLGSTADRSIAWNGHTVWYDDDSLVHPSGRDTPEFPDGPARFCDWQGGNSRTVAGRCNHLTLSPDRKWIACDDIRGAMSLYRFGETEPVARLSTPATAGGPDEVRHAHPSFSRDGGTVYFMAKRKDDDGGTVAVWAADVSRWTGGKRAWAG
jgi:hypothetical protein